MTAALARSDDGAAALAVENRRDAIAALRLQLAGVLDRGCSASRALPTGIAALDALFQGGGIPRGRLTEFLGERGSGRTTVVRQLVLQAVAAGHRVAFVDASRTLAPHDWAAPETHAAIWMVRPADASRGAWCADVLLRTGAFALVVLDGVPALRRSASVRLTNLAREHDAALVLLGTDPASSQSGGALRLRFEIVAPGAGRQAGSMGHHTSCSSRQRRKRSRVVTAASAIRIVLEKGGPRQSVEVNRAIPMARRLCAHPEVPDRRRPAAARGSTRTQGGRSADTATRRNDRQHEQHGGHKQGGHGQAPNRPVTHPGATGHKRPLDRRSA